MGIVELREILFEETHDQLFIKNIRAGSAR